MLNEDNPPPFGASVADDAKSEEMEPLSTALEKASGLAKAPKARLSKIVIMFDRI